ncbi:MAG: hypothetical protein H6Q26_3304 [Bacteroidetes bacterium]|nr:hypothetical protein [Bacteroidota bacterium]
MPRFLDGAVFFGNSCKLGTEDETGKSVTEEETCKSVAEGEIGKSITDGETCKSVAKGKTGKSVTEGETGKSVADGETGKSVTDGETGTAPCCLKSLQSSNPANFAKVFNVVTAGIFSYFSFPHNRFKVVTLNVTPVLSCIATLNFSKS